MANSKKKFKSPYGSKPSGKAKSSRKKMDPETKDKIKTGFLTFVSNNAVVKAGRNYSWWMPVILGLLSVIVALIPNFVTNMTTDVGKNFLGTTSYGFENGLVAFGEDLEAKKDDFKIEVKDQKLVMTGWNNGSWLTYNDQAATNEEPVAESGSSSEESRTVITTPIERNGFEVFYNEPALNMTDADFRSFVTTNYNPYTETARSNTLDGNGDKVYRTNFIIFAEESITFGKFPRNSTGTGSILLCPLTDIEDGFNFLSLFTLDEGVGTGTPAATDAIRLNWQKFITKAYNPTKITAAWSMTGIMAGVNAGVILLFGFVIWLMTRGKMNPFRTVKIYEGFKMAGWAAPSCAILAQFGFLLSSYASFIFIFLFGIRVMWMSMRALRPYDTGAAK